MNNKFQFIFTISSAALILFFIGCNNNDGLVYPPPDCPFPFDTEAGACACREGFARVGPAPALGESETSSKCISVQDEERYFLVTDNDCKCTSLTNNTRDSLVLIFRPHYENPEDIFSVRSHYLTPEGTVATSAKAQGYHRDHDEAQEIQFTMVNLKRISPAGDCTDIHEGLYGQLHEFLPYTEDQFTGTIYFYPTKATLDSRTNPVDSCVMHLERLHL